jgi:methylated-DNA-[protein]-cysteine S-methyltransferase
MKTVNNQNPVDQVFQDLHSLREFPPVVDVESLLDIVEVGDGYGRVDGPLGVTWVAFNDAGVSFVYATTNEAQFRSLHSARLPRRLRKAKVPIDVAAGVVSSDAQDLRVDLRHTPPFQRAVLEATRLVPLGETRAYGWVAERIGSPRAVRAVGTALGTNPIPLVIPCHRIVKADGSFGQYLFGAEAKADLLAQELVRMRAYTDRRGGGDV